ncbi:hypothetical protein Pcinc_004010 [Petrolisthes cinctipes]|uniref:HTH psq-type domain-containing protein n=1 Tax=Petrolisthes cinctipes TaxID=88211 RepID=A0AAE1L0H6_PETCI|nr:hypothetical protein Pcinc_004010 [Petrolisthes cinctipes]
MAPPPAKRPRKVLTLETKREILRRCDEGWSTARIQENFGIPKSSLCELKKARDKITDDFSVASKTGKKKDRKTMAEENTTVDDINDWLECDEGDPGQQVLTEEQIAAEVLNPDEGNDSEDDDDDSLPSRPTTSEARKAADVLLDYFEHPISSTHMQSYGPMLREVRDALIKAQSQWSKKQTKIETFFKPQPIQDIDTELKSASEDSDE